MKNNDANKQFINRDILDTMLNKDTDDIIEEEICFMIMSINNKDYNKSIKLIESLCDLINDKGAIISEIVSSYIIAYYRYDNREIISNQSKELIDSALYKFNSNVKIVYGYVNTILTFLGNDDFRSFGFIIPNFEQVLIKLIEIDYGKAKQIEDSTIY